MGESFGMQIREMTGSDVAFAVSCTRREGWQSETEDTFRSFLAFEPEGCFIAVKDGIPIGICVAVPYLMNGFIGELIIVEAERGRGYGKALFRHGLRFLQERGVRSMYLDGDLKAVPIYEKNGFRKVCRSQRFIGRIRPVDHPAARRAGGDDVEEVCKIDRTLFGDDRSFFIRRSHQLYPQMFFVMGKEGRIEGYVMARPGVGVISVGPYAMMRGDEDPLLLLRRFALEVDDIPFRIGVLETNTKAVESILACGEFQEQTPCWRMVKGSDEDLGRHEHLLAIGSAAKG